MQADSWKDVNLFMGKAHTMMGQPSSKTWRKKQVWVLIPHRETFVKPEWRYKVSSQICPNESVCKPALCLSATCCRHDNTEPTKRHFHTGTRHQFELRAGFVRHSFLSWLVTWCFPIRDVWCQRSCENCINVAKTECAGISGDICGVLPWSRHQPRIPSTATWNLSNIYSIQPSFRCGPGYQQALESFAIVKHTLRQFANKPIYMPNQSAFKNIDQASGNETLEACTLSVEFSQA